MAKTKTQRKEILLLSNNISQAAGGGNRNAIRKSYPDTKQYLAFPETKEGRKYLDTSERQRSGAERWQIIENAPLALINFTMGSEMQK